MSRLRMSSHRLQVESGRWHKPASIPLPERKCIICNVLEDEFHFILECSVYKYLRSIYIRPYFWKRPNIIKFKQLMTSTNKNTVRSLATFIFKSFEKRNDLMT